jgi:hypothetical protein
MCNSVGLSRAGMDAPGLAESRCDRTSADALAGRGAWPYSCLVAGRNGRLAMKLWIRRLLGTGLLVFGAGALAGAGGLDKNDLLCEEAMAQLLECCPDLPVQRGWCETQGCDSSSAHLSVKESECITDSSCETIEAHDICARVLRKYEPGDASLDGSAGQQVCQ